MSLATVPRLGRSAVFAAAMAAGGASSGCTGTLVAPIAPPASFKKGPVVGVAFGMSGGIGVSPGAKGGTTGSSGAFAITHNTDRYHVSAAVEGYRFLIGGSPSVEGWGGRISAGKPWLSGEVGAGGSSRGAYAKWGVRSLADTVGAGCSVYGGTGDEQRGVVWICTADVRIHISLPIGGFEFKD